MIFRKKTKLDVNTSKAEVDLIRNDLTALQNHVAYIEFDVNGNILNANNIFLSAIGCSLSQIQGQHHRIFCPEDVQRSRAYEALWDR